MPEDELESLVRRAAQGDREAQDALVRRVAQPGRDIVHRRIPNDLRRRIDTDDVFQSTVSVALAELGRCEYRGEKHFLGWLAAVAERQVVNAARRHRAGNRDVAREDGRGVRSSIPGAATEPPLRAVRRETEARVREAMAALPDDERTVLDLRTEQRLSFPEVAERMGLTDKHAARRLYLRAMAAMAERIGDE